MYPCGLAAHSAPIDSRESRWYNEGNRKTHFPRKDMDMYYLFTQNRRSPRYDESKGLSQSVIIYASSKAAAEQKVESLFGENKVTFNYIMRGSLPLPNAVLVTDNRLSYPHQKVMAEGKYDVFVHEKDGSFYGAYARHEVIDFIPDFYYFRFADYGMISSSLHEVDKDGYERASGDGHNPIYRGRLLCERIPDGEQTVTYSHFSEDEFYGRTYMVHTISGRDRDRMEKVFKRVSDHLERNRIDPKGFLN